MRAPGVGAGILWAGAHAHRWPPVVVGAAVCSVLTGLLGRVTVPLPLVNDPVALMMVLIVFVAAFTALPLASAFPEVERTLPREVPLRIARAAGVVGLLGLTLVPARLMALDPPQGHLVLVLGLTLSALGMLSACLVGELAWAPPLGLGLLLVILDGAPHAPVTYAVWPVPAWAAGIVWVAVAVVFVRRGPRAPW